MDEVSQRALAWAHLGRVGYLEAEALQERLRASVIEGSIPDQLLLLEHDRVFTLGRSATREDVLLDSRELQRRGVEVAETDRGGQVTYHGPGQLVGYPIIDLAPDRRDVRRYVGDLQRVLIRTLAHFGIQAVGRSEQPYIGVWVGERKIGSIGVHLSRWVTTHGFALNVSTDLSLFEGIVPCGVPNLDMTSIERELETAPALAEVAFVCAAEFGSVFDRRLEEVRWEVASQDGGSSESVVPERTESR